MKVRTTEVKEARSKFFAVRDRAMRNAINATLHTTAAKNRAERMKLALELVYYNKGVYVNYNKKSISVKVDAAIVRNNKDLAYLEEEWQDLGVQKLVTEQGISYTL